MDKEKYIKNPVFCPRCESSAIHSGPIEANGKTAWAEVACEWCGERWKDIFTLTDVEMENM